MNNIKHMTKPEAGTHYDDITLLSIDTLFVLLVFGLTGLFIVVMLKNLLAMEPKSFECELVRVHGESKMKKFCDSERLERLTIVLDQDGELRIQGSPRRKKKPVMYKGYLINNGKRLKKN